MTSDIESVSVDGKLYCHIIRGGRSPAKTTFVTARDSVLQLGFVAREAGATIQRHLHKPVERRILGTPEFLLVRSGRCEVDLYSDERELVATRELFAGDAILLLAGGHGFRVHEDTVLLEVKQGPYAADDDKVPF